MPKNLTPEQHAALEEIFIVGGRLITRIVKAARREEGNEIADINKWIGQEVQELVGAIDDFCDQTEKKRAVEGRA